jgi:hypothetical protein
MNATPRIWGIFVGWNGDQLESLNSRSSPFPPEEDAEGCIAIGWPAIGDLRMYKDRYDDYVRMFRVIYHNPGEAENVFKAKANMPWYFAFGMKRGDWIISPCSTHGLLFVGEIIGDYKPDFHDESGFFRNRRCPDFVHMRQVLWKCVIPRADQRYGKLHRIGRLTLSRSNIDFDELQRILQGEGRAE